MSTTLHHPERAKEHEPDDPILALKYQMIDIVDEVGRRHADIAALRSLIPMHHTTRAELKAQLADEVEPLLDAEPGFDPVFCGDALNVAWFSFDRRVSMHEQNGYGEGTA